MKVFKAFMQSEGPSIIGAFCAVMVLVGLVTGHAAGKSPSLMSALLGWGCVLLGFIGNALDANTRRCEKSRYNESTT